MYIDMYIYIYIYTSRYLCIPCPLQIEHYMLCGIEASKCIGAVALKLQIVFGCCCFVFGCFWLFLVAFGCVRLLLVAFGCF